MRSDLSPWTTSTSTTTTQDEEFPSRDAIPSQEMDGIVVGLFGSVDVGGFIALGHSFF